MSEELPDWIADHIKLYRTDPETARLWNPPFPGAPQNVPTLLLTTIGAKSGQPRPLPLIYGEDNGRYAVVASKGGAPEHPAWYRNLIANPDVEIDVGAMHSKARARTASAQERVALWPKMTAIWPMYNDYQNATSREIPIVILEPLGA